MNPEPSPDSGRLLTADRCQRLRDDFDHLVDLPADQREPWLQSAVADPDDRDALRILLAAESTDGPLEVPAEQRLQQVLADAGSTARGLVGQRIGAYRLLGILGQGGSSIVFLAQREGVDFEQRVALKLLRRGLYSALEQRLFQREQQLLASLSHPNIAHLIDGGITDAGIPYLVLEHIDGQPLTSHAQDRQLPVPDRLRLFVLVCDAVAAAHRQLIVHRDLKPSNILVTAAGEVKLLDFGVAKLLDESDPGATRTGALALTPGYAAPEQVAGDTVTTAADVFSLGVVLHELLLGVRPTPAHERPAPAPAPAGTAPRLAPGSDLARILGKALAPAPDQRYPSAADLGADVRRHLQGLPVHAHPPSRRYRVGKFVRRHRASVLATAALSLALVASLGAALWQTQVAREQARLARLEARHAEEARGFLVGLFDARIPARPDEQTPDTAELLRRGVDRAMTELTDEPALQSTLLVSLSRVYHHLDYGDKAMPLLDQALAAARAAQPPDPGLLASALSERGALDLSRNRYEPAIDWLNQAIALQQQHDPGGLSLAVSLDRRGLARAVRGEYDAALDDYRAAQALRQRQLPPEHPELIHSLHAIGSTLDQAGRHEAAQPLLAEATALAQKRFGDAHVKTAHYLKSQAANLGYLGQLALTVPLLERAVAAERALYPPGHISRGKGLNNLGAHYFRLGRLAEAVSVLEEAAALNVAAGQAESMGHTFVLGNLARCFEALGNGAQALVQLQRAESIAADLVGADHARTRALVLQRARLQVLFDPSAAAALLTVAQDIQLQPERLGQFRTRSLPEARYAQGLALAVQGHHDEARAAWRALLDEPGTPTDDLFWLGAAARLAEFEHAQGSDDAARALLLAALARAEPALPGSHYAVGELHLLLAELGANGDGDHLGGAAAGLAELPATHPLPARLASLRGPASP